MKQSFLSLAIALALSFNVAAETIETLPGHEFAEAEHHLTAFAEAEKGLFGLGHGSFKHKNSFFHHTASSHHTQSTHTESSHHTESTPSIETYPSIHSESSHGSESSLECKCIKNEISICPYCMPSITMFPIEYNPNDKN